MRKLIFISLMFSTLSIAIGQDKGSYITVGGDLGLTKFLYDIEDGSSKGKIGYGGNIGYQYFFNRHWGLSLQGEFSVFNSQSRYSDKLFTFPNQVDDENDIYDLDVRLNRWKENQTTYFLNIPLMLMYQHKFGSQQQFGLYAGLGGKFQLPIKSSYKRHAGTAYLSAYYSEHHLNILDEYPLPLHGYGSNDALKWDGDNELNIGLALTGEFGFLISLSRRVDLTLGVSSDYGLLDVKDKNVNLLSPTGNQQQVEYIGQHLAYNGILNSSELEKNHPFSLKGEIGLRFKIGKLTERRTSPKTKEEQSEEMIGLLRELANKRDTVIVNPVIEVAIPDNYYDYPRRSEGIRGGAAGEDPNGPYDGLTIDEVEIMMEPVYFDLNKSTLRRDARETLDKKVALLKQHDIVSCTILGHTCDLGSSKYNLELSKRRAESVRMYLISKGVQPSRLSVVPEGKNHPDTPNDTEEHRQLNRKVEFIVGR